MTTDQLIRRTLWGTAAFNIGGSLVIAFPASSLGQLNGFPADAPPLYRALVGLFIFAYGCAYAWLARQDSISRPFIAFVAANKFCVFAAVFILWLSAESSFRSVIALGGDLVFSALFVFWLYATGQASNHSFRPARESDATAVAACVHAAYQHYITRIGREPGPMLDDYAKVIRERQVTVAESRGRVAGVLVLDETSEGFLLENVAVDPGQKGKGLGRTLLELAEAEAKRAGFDSIYLYTHEKMTENQALYAKIGYVEYDRRFEAGLARVYMRKKLP